MDPMNQQPPVLVLLASSSGQGVPGDVLQHFFTASGAGMAAAEFACASERLGLGSGSCGGGPSAAVAAAAGPASGSRRYNAAFLAAGGAAEQQQAARLAAVGRLLTPGAVLYVYKEDANRRAALLRDLLLTGYVEGRELPAMVTGCMVCAKRPDYEIGAKAALSLKKRPASAVAPAVPAPAAPASKWQLALGDDEEMMDDEELLTEEDKARPQVPTGGDCSTSRKACNDCSCGRAEKEAAGELIKLTQEMLDNPQSSCGSCTLGDAFRCAGCPYRGLPSFEQGKKITLGSDLLTDLAA